jgi:peptidoglycan/xylan/chitin deacetylase (PgdA/CDA1 family)
MPDLPLPILLYHDVSGTAHGTSPDVFREHMRLLTSRGIAGLGLERFESALVAGALPEEPSVLITFDDGLADFLDEALPILREFDLQATAFLITGAMGQPAGASAPYGATLNWDQARILRDSGRVSLQSHGHTHARWPMTAASNAILADELIESRRILARELELPIDQIRHLAWPWGRCNARFEAIAAEAGFTHQYLVQNGAVTHGNSKLRLPRLCCDGMPLHVFSRWIDILMNPLLSRIATQVSGLIRKRRHGLAYR